ncbi:MAG TPA: NAD-dependent epimerase/dehydratase family protein [Patescibacteria group bacterium]|nr:NAD-dependent epimerase/dehydratase family protein [Patescibacteria group bacterium]
MNVLVTGGGGFLGAAICRLLKARGDQVVSLSRSHHAALDALGVKQMQGDVSALDSVLAASQGCDAIIHTAALAGLWGDLDDFSRTNIGGTVAVLGACELNGIGKLVYTSTPSVVHGGHDIEGGDERLPYATHFTAHYPATKAIAEQRVLAANSGKLATVALRPHLIWGPGDNHLLPRILKRARSGQLRFIGPPKMIDTIYIDNAAQAHLDALDRVAPGAACAGKPYFISQDQPIALDDMVNRLLRSCGQAAVTKRISPTLAKLAGKVLEAIWRSTGKRDDPPMTRFLAEQLSTAHWFNIGAAKRDLGYQPKISITEGMVRLQDWWQREGRHRA